MKIGFVVNDIATEQPGYTTTHLAMAATRIGHEAWYVSVNAWVAISRFSRCMSPSHFEHFRFTLILPMPFRTFRTAASRWRRLRR